MRRPSKMALMGPTLAVIGVLVAVVGCGTSEYRRLMGRRVDDLRTSAPFRILFGPSQLAGTPLRIRVPMAFTKSYTEDSTHKQDKGKIRPDRVQPPFLKLPGFKVCYEGTAEDSGVGWVPFYCYLAALPVKPGDADKLAADLQAQLKQKIKETPDEWRPVDAYSPDGKATPWKKLRVVADQPFQVFNGQVVETKNLPAIFELWMRDTGDYVALVGWRTPKSIDGPPPTETAPPKPGTRVQPVVAKPDLSETPTSMPILTAGTLTVDGALAAPADAPPAAP